MSIVQEASLADLRYHDRMRELRDYLIRMGVEDLTPTQALIVYRMGEHSEVGKAFSLGCYRGQNPSYNTRKLVEHGYIKVRRSRLDKRANIYILTDRGAGLRKLLITCAS